MDLCGILLDKENVNWVATKQ